MRSSALVFGVILATTGAATYAAVIKVGGVEFPNATFVPDSVRVAAGDTVRWYQIDGEHTSTSGTGSGDPQAGQMYNGTFGSGPLDFDFQFNTPGSYSNFCIPHEPFGMKGKIVVTPAVAAHVAAVGDIFVSFNPDSVKILTGETVEFYWGSGDHTVTSGIGSGDPQAGNMLNSNLNFEVPAVQLTFNSPGVYPFFCTPHEFDDMRTTVYVSDPCNCPCKYDPECDGITSDVLDVTRAVGVAFRNVPAITDPGCLATRTDVNFDNQTDILDVTRVVAVAFRNGTVAANYDDPCN